MPKLDVSPRSLRFLGSPRVLLGIGALLAVGCAPPMDASTALGKQAILDEVDLQLTQGNCADALAIITPVYQSAHTDNAVRLRMAASFACSARVNSLSLISELVSNSGSIAGKGFWPFLTRLFPSTTADRVPEASGFAAEALFSVLRPGAVVATSSRFRWGTVNPGSLDHSDRSSEANIFLMFTSMAGIGGAQNRFGAPDSSYAKTTELPWFTAATMTVTGCQYAASVVNMIDALGAAATQAAGPVKTTLESVQSAFATAIDAACDKGCEGGVPAWGLNDSGCAIMPATTCDTCPLSLRDGTACTLVATDATTCAAAGVVEWINQSPLGWVP